MRGPVWHLVTGEYPPQPGGIGDYTAQLAAGLAVAGAEVHVWTSAAGETPEVPGVRVHRIGGGWSPADLAHLDNALNDFPGARQILVQYTPNAWGYRGLNLGFCRWVVSRDRRGDGVCVMFHEVAYPWMLRDRPTRWLLAAGHRWMARILMKSEIRPYVSTPAWKRLLRTFAPGDRRPIGWLPIPSNISVVDDLDAVASARRRVTPGGEAVVGSFSSFSELTGPPLAAILPRVLRDRTDRVGLLIGMGGDRLKARMVAENPGLAGRIVATGALSPAEVSAHIQACDLMIQPYPDGVTTRRTSFMASLAHGVPAVSNAGHLTEPFWAGSGALGLAAGVDGMADLVEDLMAEPGARQRIGAAGRALYERRFAIGRTVEALIGRPLGVAL